MCKPFFFATLIFLCTSLVVHTQPAKLGIKGNRTEGELAVTDPKFDDANRHYRTMSFTLKAGQGIEFVMQSNAFTPLVVLLGKDGKTFGTLRSAQTENYKEAGVAFIAQRELYPESKIFIPADSSFTVIFTSQEDNATGKFLFGYKLLDSAQMIYDGHSFCSRLIYLINHWQADWAIIPESLFNAVPHPDVSTTNVLVPAETIFSIETGTGFFKSSFLDAKASYYETMFVSQKDKGESFYQKITDDIKNCLGETNWSFETETKETTRSKTTIHYFYTKGATKDQSRKSFKVAWNQPAEINSLYQYEVQLIFD